MKNIDGNDLLWEAFKAGSRKAFSNIYHEYAPILLNYASKIVSNQQVIEDCIQDLFIELWTSRERLTSTTSIKFYLFKAIRYKIYRKLNGERTRATEDIDDYTTILKDYSDEENYIEAESQSLQILHLRDQVEKLPTRQREAINLRYYHQFSNEQIAQIMGVTYTSACKFIYAGLKNLKEHIKASAI